MAVLRTTRRHLQSLVEAYGPEHLASDPLEIPRRYDDVEDRETAAFIAALLAFGNARAVRASAAAALEALGPSPAEAAERLAAGGPPPLQGPLHRWVQGEDLCRFLAALGRLRRDAGSLEDAFLSRDRGGEDYKAALEGFVELLAARVEGQASRGLRYLLVSPAKGSACKRWNMLLRWLVRPDDGLDLGLWTRLSPARLLVPLDTHIARLGRYLGFTERRSPGWSTAAEITASLRRLDPEDPIRYDFALTRLGILDHCPRRRDPERCAACSLVEICTL